MNHNTNNPNDGTVKVAVEFDLPVSELEQLSTRSHQQSHLASQPTQPGTGRSEILSSYGGQRGEDVPRGGNLEGQEFGAGSSYQDHSFAGGALAPKATAFARDHSHEGSRHHHHHDSSAHGRSAVGESQYSTRSSHPGTDIQTHQGRTEDSHHASTGMAAGGALAGAGAEFGQSQEHRQQHYTTSGQTGQETQGLRRLPHGDRTQQHTSSQTGTQGDAYGYSGTAGGAFAGEALAGGAAGYGVSQDRSEHGQRHESLTEGQAGPTHPEETVVETSHQRSDRDEQGRELDSYGKPYNV